MIAAISQVEYEAPQGRVNISAENNHMLCNSFLARVTDQANFEIVKGYGQIPPVVPGCKLS